MKRSVLETIGSPLVQVSSPPGSVVAAKIESENPGGSAKDRPALFMIERAEREGVLEPGGHIVEPTSGNTGIGLAVAAAVKRYDLTLVMPEGKSVERRQIMAAYGANIELVGGSGISAARERADELEREAGMVQVRQFENPANPDAHYHTTAEEILRQVGDRGIDALVAGVGTGGTLTGIGRRIRETHPEMEVVAVEPEENAVLSTGESGSDDYQGMGPGFVSENLDTDLVDSVETVSLEAAEAECRRLASEEGILVGQSSGGSNLAAKRVARRLAEDEAVDAPTAPDREARVSESIDERVFDEQPAPEGAPLVITVFWDSGERYMSTGLFDEG
ncbi:MAG: PLP-dependent cysteine synthase family protein [Halobacteriales archaeon]